MKILSSYVIKVKHISKLFKQTIKIYNDAVSCCISVFENEWSVLSQLQVYNRERASYADKLIHTTKSNAAKHPEFDVNFRMVNVNSIY